jgi:hypothetical protein
MNSDLVLIRYFAKYFSAIIFTALMLFAASCKKESSTSAQNTIPSNLKLISSGYAGGASTRVDIYAATDLYAGYNKLYIALYDSASNNRITQAQVSLSAMTDAGMNGPVENPVGTNADNGLFNAASVFVSSGSWTVTTHIRNTAGSGTGSFIASINVVQPSPAKSYSVMTADSSNLFVSIVQPTNPLLGVNNFEVVVDRQINTMNYTPDSTYMISIDPTMPLMTGMSSPNNVNPSYTGNGHYTGKVDFIMGGGWQIYVDLLRNGVASDTSHYFSLNL